MSSLQRPLASRAMHFELGADKRSALIDPGLLEKAGRSARTLIKDGPLRVTLIAVAPGGEMRTHRAPGPITLHVLSGEIHLRAGTDEWKLATGDLLSLGAGVEHSVHSESGGEFLLTVTQIADHGPA